MIIEIDQSCYESNLKEKFFNYISKYIYGGRLYIFISKKLLEKLYNDSQIDFKSQSIYRKMFENSSEDLMIRNSVTMCIRITDTKDDISFSNGEIIMSMNFAVENEVFSNSSKLICENYEDCDFLEFILKVYKKTKKLAVNTRFEHISGGGSQISNSYLEHSNKNDISLLYVDSDIQCLNGKEGTTIRKLKEEMRQYQITSVHVLSFKFNEIENLIPIELIKSFYSKKPNQIPDDYGDFLLFTEKLIDKESFLNTPISYYDFKKGIDEKHLNDDNNYSRYWNGFFNSINMDYPMDIKGRHFYFCKDILNKINGFIKDISITDSFFHDYNANYLEDIWCKIGEYMYSYGVVREKILYL